MKRPITTSLTLIAYSRGEIGSREAIRGIGGIGFSHLLDAMADAGLPLPRGRGHEEETHREVEEALPILQAALRSLPSSAPDS